MKDFNLKNYLLKNPLKSTLKKGTINEAFEGFGGVGTPAVVGEGVPMQKKDFNTNTDPWGWEDQVKSMRDDEQSRPNKWIADIDRLQPRYGDWMATYEYPGIIVWDHPDIDGAVVVATPGWDGKGTPVEFQSKAGSTQMLKVLDQDNFPNVKSYIAAVAPYLDMVEDANLNPTGETPAAKFQGLHEADLGGMQTLFVMDYNSGKVFSKMVSGDMQSEEIEQMLADEYGMNPSDVYYMITNQSEVEDLDDTQLNENDDYYNENPNDRMEGLVNQRELAAFAKAALNIAQDLDDEGFEFEDVIAFLTNKLEDIMSGTSGPQIR